MSYDLCEFEECFFTDPLSPLSDSSSIDILKAFQENNYNSNPLTHEILDTPFQENDQITPTITTTTTTTTTTTLLSSSPPCNQLQTLSIHQMGNSVNSLDLCPIEIKTENTHLPFYDYYIQTNSLLPHSYGSKSSDGTPNCYLFQPKINSLIEPSNLQSLHPTSPDHSFSSCHMRRVCSTGDLQNLETKQKGQTLSSSPLGNDGSLMEEANFKVGRYSPEERKEKILRYKAKRTQRNFNKTIKYACRKTLADSRPRIRGRFARNDDPEEIPKAYNFQGHRNEEELWIERLQEEYHEGIPRWTFFNTYMPTAQFHQFSHFAKEK